MSLNLDDIRSEIYSVTQKFSPEVRPFEMPNTKSAKKRLRQDKVRQSRNKAIKSAVRSSVKKVSTALDSGDIAGAEEAFVAAAKKLDRAGAKNIIHKNTAARKKSRMQKAIVKAKNA